MRGMLSTPKKSCNWGDRMEPKCAIPSLFALDLGSNRNESRHCVGLEAQCTREQHQISTAECEEVA